MAARPPEVPISEHSPTLFTLGRAALVLPGLERPLLGPGKPFALLSYLHFSPGKSASREHLLDLLWSDSEPDRARTALRQTLWQLRSLLGDDLLGGRDEITLLHAFDSDRDQFLDAVTRGALNQALELYRGAFLPGFAAPGGAGFEQWADLERERLRNTFVRASETQVRRLLASGHARDALPVARRVVDLGDEEELGRRLLLESHLASADMISAATEADALERWAATEQAQLEPATQDVLRRSRRADATPVLPDGAPPRPSQLIGELVGREKEFATILGAWSTARSGHHRHVHLLAPAGLGKSRLLHDLEARLTAVRGTVCYLRANPGDRAIPGALAADTARALSNLPGAMGISTQTAATLVALDPSLSGRYTTQPDPATGDEARRRRTMAISELAGALAAEAPFALLIDDMHWADAESHAILEAVAARLAGTASLLVTASRPVAEQHFRSDQRETLRLDPLDATQIASFLMSLGQLDAGDASNQLVPQLLAATGGSPLLVTEMLQLALERSVISLTDGRWMVADANALTALLREGEGIRQRIGRLSETSRRLLGTLAVAGAPVRKSVLAAATRVDEATVESHLIALERTGFATQLSTGWEPAHDAIAEQATAGSASERDDIERSLGRALLADVSRDHTTRARAAQHLARVDDVAALAALATDELHGAHRRGDRTTTRDVLVQLLPENGKLRDRVLRALTLPVRLRYGAHARSAVVASVITTAVMVTAFVARRHVAPVDEQLVVFTGTGAGQSHFDQAPLRREGWQAGDTLRTTHFEKFDEHVGARAPVSGDLANWAGGDSVIITHAFADSGGQDLVLITGDSSARLTDGRNDDVAPALSPDHEQIAFLSSRWSPDSAQNTDVALLDLRDRRVRRVTEGPAFDHRPAWSPDGTRIAFVRVERGHAALMPRLCLVTIEFAPPQCLEVKGIEPVEVVGWLDWRTVLVVARGDKTQLLAAIDIPTLTHRTIEGRSVFTASLSPDRRWLACWCESDPTAGSRLEVRPIEQPDGWRPVAMGASTERFMPSWIDTHPDSTWIASIHILPPGQITPGATHLLKFAVIDARGRAAAFDTTTLRWRSSDTTIAAVDSLTGAVHAHRLGRVVFRVSAGGWRETGVSVVVERAVADTLLVEPWTDLRRWGTFGLPSPIVVDSSPVGRAFLNNGDDTYSSGVWSHAEFGAERGLALDAALSTPINGDQWQSVYAAFTTARDSATLARSAGQDPEPVLRADEETRGCAVSYPRAEGAGNDRYLLIRVAGRTVPIPRPTDLSTGRPWRLRLQLFADGTCGIAINGVPLFRSPNAVALDQPMRVWIKGSSVKTRMVMGAVTVWRGDPGDVDWSGLDQSGARRVVARKP